MKGNIVGFSYRAE